MSSRLAPVGVQITSMELRSLIFLQMLGVEAQSIGSANVFQTKCHVGAAIRIPDHCSIGKQIDCADVSVRSSLMLSLPQVRGRRLNQEI
jgi:hypothetical protein